MEIKIKIEQDQLEAFQEFMFSKVVEMPRRGKDNG
jgi:hypothetical protein